MQWTTVSYANKSNVSLLSLLILEAIKQIHFYMFSRDQEVQLEKEEDLEIPVAL